MILKYSYSSHVIWVHFHVLLPEKRMIFFNKARLSELEEVSILMCCLNFMVQKSLSKDYDCAVQFLSERM
jgi:hypothetical protein